MKLLKIASVFVALTGVLAVGLVMVVVIGRFAPSVRAQARQEGRALSMLAGRGAAIGVSIRDVPTAEAGGDRAEGVVVDDVRPDSPADKAGVKRGDTIVSFDGERVRSARQFTRLVQETTPGKTVNATILRDGKRSDVKVTPDERRGDMMISGDWGDFGRYFGDWGRDLGRDFGDWGKDLGRDFGRLGDRMPNFNFNFDFDNLAPTGRRLGVSVDELTGQLATYFGAKDGLLVTSVNEDSPASRAGIKAGDVITSIDGRAVTSREDLQRGIRDAKDGEDLTIGIVRDKKDTSVKAKIEPVRRPLRGRPA